MSQSKLVPKLVTVFQEGYSRSQFGSDLLAGVIVGIVALPLAIAFAIASGVKPEQGLYTAIIAGLVISVLSGSRVQIGGPTGAIARTATNIKNGGRTPVAGIDHEEIRIYRESWARKRF